MHVYAMIVGLTDMGVGVASMVVAPVYGYLFDIDPALPFHVAFGFSCLFFVHCAAMQVMASCHARKHAKVRELGEDTRGLLSETEGDGEEGEEVELEVVGGKLRFLRDSGVVTSSAGENSDGGEMLTK